jgi:hypothetical protein
MLKLYSSSPFRSEPRSGLRVERGAGTVRETARARSGRFAGAEKEQSTDLRDCAGSSGSSGELGEPRVSRG